MVGMLVDLSHVSVQTMQDAISHSIAPVIFSHSSAYSVYHHERNVPDSVLKRLADKDGVVMINFYKAFVTGDEECTVDTVAEHVLHVAKVAGWKYTPHIPRGVLADIYRHVGIGSDFDGIDMKCAGLEDSSMYPNLVAAVLRMAPETTDEEISGFLGQNVLRVWEKAEAVKDQMKSSKPSEAIWEGREPWKFEL
jgi:membrane dipeptidase